MATSDGLCCKRCGSRLEPSDLRQMAVYYRTENTSLLAVQYVCPDCGVTEWQRCPGERWPLGLDPSTVPVVDLGSTSAPAAETRSYDLAQPISTDEYIEFCVRLARLTPADLAQLGGSGP